MNKKHFLKLVCYALIFSALAFLNATNAKAQSYDLTNLPNVIFEDGVENWRVARFAGNDMAGSLFYQGPALEAGGIQYPQYMTEGSDGTIYFASTHQRVVDPPLWLMKVTPDGTLRAVMDPDGLIEGPIESCRSGIPVWNPHDNTLYLSGPNVLRKVAAHPDGTQWVEIVAGIPNVAGLTNGPALTSKLNTPFGIVCDSTGACYWMETSALRKIHNGTVSTIALTNLDYPGYLWIANPGINLLTLGEDTNTLYISDYAGMHGRGIFKVNLTAGTLKRIIGIDKDYNIYGRSGEADGPALTHVSFTSGARGHYDPFHNAIWIGGADGVRFRWLRLPGGSSEPAITAGTARDGWVRTVAGATRPGTTAQTLWYNDVNGVPSDSTKGVSYGEQFNYGNMGQPADIGADSKGRIFLVAFGDATGLWRMYNTKEVTP